MLDDIFLDKTIFNFRSKYSLSILKLRIMKTCTHLNDHIIKRDFVLGGKAQ